MQNVCPLFVGCRAKEADTPANVASVGATMFGFPMVSRQPAFHFNSRSPFQNSMSEAPANPVSSPSTILRALIDAKCLTRPSSTLNVPGGKEQSERLPLSQPESCPRRSSASHLQAVRSITVLSAVYSNSISAGQIVQAIKEGRWTSTQVVTAFIKSAIRAQDETNCVTEGAWAF